MRHERISVFFEKKQPSRDDGGLRMSLIAIFYGCYVKVRANADNACVELI